MKYIDLFAGIGGFRYALDRVGMECVFTSEIDKTPTDMYKLLHGEDNIAGDVLEIDEKDVPAHDLMVGGITCQGFSTNGNRKGFDHDTGNLFFEVTRIAKEKKPKFVLIENVPGLLNHNQGESISVMLRDLSAIGYKVDFTVLNTLDFGIPQQRKRVFIVAALFPNEVKWERSAIPQVQRAKDTALSKYPEIATFNFPFPIGNSHTKTLSGIIEDVESPVHLDLGDFLTQLGESEYRIKDGTNAGYTDFIAIPNETTIDYTFMASKTRRGRVKHGFTKTLDQSVDIAVYDGIGFRRITTKEVFRLQGFSDKVHDTLKNAGFSVNQLYARPSRSVSIPIVEAIGKAITQYSKEFEVEEAVKESN